MTFVAILLALALAAALTFALRAVRARDAALAAERRMRRLAVHDPNVALGLLDRDLRIVELEGEAFERSGWRRDEFLGNRYTDVVDPERAKPVLALMEAAFAGEAGVIEASSSRNGMTFRMDFLPFAAEGRETTHVAVLVRDISEELELRRSLERQQVFLRAILTELGERVRVADADGRLHAFDGSERDDDLHPLEWAEHFGLHHLDGRPFGPHETPLLRALRGEQVRPLEVLVDTPRGRRTLLASGGPVTGPDGEPLGAVIVNADLTDFRDAEGRLRLSEERHRRVVESVSDCVFEADAQGRWTHLTEAWTLATGFAVQDALGRPVGEFVHPEDRAAHARAFAPLMGGQRVALRHGHRYLTAAGAERWAEVQVRAISGWDGLPTGFVGVIRDVTDERRAQQHVAAEQAVMRTLTTMQSLEDGGPQLLEILGTELGWDGAELWRMGDDDRLRRSAHWVAPAGGLDAFVGSGEWLTYEVGDGLPGMAWMSRAALWRADITQAGQVRRDEALADGVRSTVALPLRANGVPVGVIMLVSKTPREPESGLNRLLEAVGGQVTAFLQRRQAEARVAAQAEDLRTLASVAHELSAENDLFAARNTLCRAVRDVTGSVSVALLEPSGHDALMVTAAVGTAVLRMTVTTDARSVTSEAFISGELIHVADVFSDVRAASCQAVAGSRSAAWVPVVRDGRSVGVLAVGWPDFRPELTDRDAELLRLLAAEAAITIHRTDLLARLQSTARTDPLTGLPNRRVWDEDLDRELARARRHGGALCLAMLDLDKFKVYNDTHGHQAGDELLEAAAAAWRPHLRATDTLARYGGEEFAVLLPHSDLEGAQVVIERLLGAVPFGQTASAGIALWDGVEDADMLLARADGALYGAKHAGRARALVAA